MTTYRMQDWDAGEFSRSFRTAAQHSDVPEFRDKFSALAAALEPLDHEFLHETAGCGANLGEVLGEVRSIAARMNYCDRDRGLAHTCEEIYGDVDRAVDHVEALRQVCFS